MRCECDHGGPLSVAPYSSPSGESVSAVLTCWGPYGWLITWPSPRDHAAITSCESGLAGFERSAKTVEISGAEHRRFLCFVNERGCLRLATAAGEHGHDGCREVRVIERGAARVQRDSDRISRCRAADISF